METPEEAVDRELLDVARGDAGRARLLRESLQRLVDQDSQPDLRELAQDVLGGRTSLRTAMLSEAYSSALRQPMSNFLTWYKNLSTEERQELEAAGREQLARARAQAAQSGDAAG